MHLAGDIGGTKTLLGLFTPDRGPRHPVELAALASRDFRSAGALLGQFLDGRKIDGATFGVAGAVLNDGAWGPNLPWKIVRTELRRALGGTPVRLLNDLEAIATFVPELESGDLVVLAEGVPTEHGPIGVIAPGTGIGQAMLLWGRGGYRAVASEAGHVDFASNTALQDDYLAFLRARYGHVSLERACSGNSFPLLFEFLTGAGFTGHPDVLSASSTTKDPTPTIVEAGLDGHCTASTLALEMFVEMLGAAAGNLALQVVATGGIYLAGGIPARILPALRHPRFLTAFTHKGRFSDLASRIPIHVIVNPQVGLFGAALCGLNEHSGVQS